MSQQTKIIVPKALTPRWYPLRPHPLQLQVWNSRARFIVNPAGRRSGKTELAKRKLVRAAIAETLYHDAWFVAAAPTIAQARRIYWRDLIELTPPSLVLKKNETDMVLRLYNGAEIQVLGLEKPERAEGRPLNGIVIDEYADTKPGLWDNNIRPALADREGWAHFIGVPEGRNHYWELFKYATSGEDDEWAGFTWTSEGILSEKEINSLRRKLDPRTYDQEVKASFVTFEGKVYYTFDDANILPAGAVAYDPNRTLILCFDFNVEPGVCAIVQEHVMFGTVVIDEVYIPTDSNSRMVATEVLSRYGDHKGRVEIYGDATGGARGSAKVDGSDWEIVWNTLRPKYGTRLVRCIPTGNPPERSRVNSTCARICSVSGLRQLYVLRNCPHVIEDLEGVVYSAGTNEIEKKKNPTLTHISDALGYHVVYKYPLRETYVTTVTAA